MIAEESNKDIIEQQRMHFEEKNDMREQKKADKDSGIPVLIFDMEI